MSASLNDIPLELLHHYQDKGMTETEMVIAYTKFRDAKFKSAHEDFADDNFDDTTTIAAHHDGGGLDRRRTKIHRGI